MPMTQKSFELLEIEMITLHYRMTSKQQWHLKFNVSKYKHLHFGAAHHYGDYYLNGTLIDTTTTHRDLGFLFDDQLKFHIRMTHVTAKANRILGLIKRSFEYLDSTMLILLLNTLSWNRIILYGTSLYSRQKKVEKVQRRATCFLPQFHDNSCTERLTLLSLPSLLYKQLRGDLIFLFKILNNYFTTDFTDLYVYSRSVIRGHQFKFLRSTPGYCVDQITFLNRIKEQFTTLCC